MYWFIGLVIYLLILGFILFYIGITSREKKVQPTSAVSVSTPETSGGLSPVAEDLMTHIHAALLVLDPESSAMLFAQCAYSAADTWAREQIGEG